MHAHACLCAYVCICVHTYTASVCICVYTYIYAHASRVHTPRTRTAHDDDHGRRTAIGHCLVSNSRMRTDCRSRAALSASHNDSVASVTEEPPTTRLARPHANPHIRRQHTESSSSFLIHRTHSSVTRSRSRTTSATAHPPEGSFHTQPHHASSRYNTTEFRRAGSHAALHSHTPFTPAPTNLTKALACPRGCQ